VPETHDKSNFSLNSFSLNFFRILFHLTSLLVGCSRCVFFCTLLQMGTSGGILIHEEFELVVYNTVLSLLFLSLIDHLYLK